MSKRIQRKRIKGWRMPANAVYVGRPTKWGNPYPGSASKLDAYSRASAVEFYKLHLERHPELVAAAKRELSGKDLVCWCPLDQPCHADALLELTNRLTQTTHSKEGYTCP